MYSLTTEIIPFKNKTVVVTSGTLSLQLTATVVQLSALIIRRIRVTYQKQYQIQPQNKRESKAELKFILNQLQIC